MFGNSKLEELLDPHACKRVIGTYLYPHVVFGDINHGNSYSLTEVVKRINVESKEVLVSKNGGLFVQPPPSFDDPIKDDEDDEKDDFWGKIQFEQGISKAFDQIICELAFNSGVVSEPATPAYISRGQLKENHVLVSGGGGFQVPNDRVLKPSLDLLSGLPQSFKNQREGIEVLDEIEDRNITTELVQVSENLPTFIVNAYAATPRRQPTRAIVSAWVVIEQLIEEFWDKFCGDVESEKREGILKHAIRRPAIKTEMLYESGVINLELCENLHKARQNRNNVMHKSEVSPDLTKESIFALRDMIEFYCGESVNIPQLNTSINW